MDPDGPKTCGSSRSGSGGSGSGFGSKTLRKTKEKTPTKILARDLVLRFARRMQRGLIDHIGNIRPGEAGGEQRQPLAVPALLLLQHHSAEVLLKDLLALDEGGQVDGDVTVEAARAQQSAVQNVGPELVALSRE